MIFGKQKIRRYAQRLNAVCVPLLWGLLLSGLLTFSARAQTTTNSTSFELAQLLPSLVLPSGGKLYFQEVKYLNDINRPLRASGELIYRPPHILERLTLKPQRELLQLDRDALSIERAGKQMRLSLAEAPQIAVLITGLRALLQGDQATLQASYSTLLLGSSARWTLHLTPKTARAGLLLKRIQIDGGQGQIYRIETEMNDGDRSVMQLSSSAK